MVDLNTIENMNEAIGFAKGLASCASLCYDYGYDELAIIILSKAEKVTKNMKEFIKNEKEKR